MRAKAAQAAKSPFGEGSGHPVPVAVETFHALRRRQTNLLNWDGRGRPESLFPEAGPVRR